MFNEVAVVLSGVSAVLFAMFKIGTRRRVHLNLPPGPKGVPVFGNALQLDKSRLHQNFHQLSQLYGPIFHVRLMNVDVIVLCSSDLLSKAFKQEAHSRLLNDKPTGFYGTYLMYGNQDVLFGPYSDTTFRLKSLMAHSLAEYGHERNVKVVLESLVDLFHGTRGDDFDPGVIVKKVMADAVAVQLCGEALDGDSDLIWEFVECSNKVLNPSIQSLLKRLPFLRHLPGTPGTLFRNAREKRDRLLDRVVTQSKQTYDPSRCRGLVDVCIAEQLEAGTAEATCWLTDERIRTLVLDVIGGGLLTNTNTILCCLLSLLNNTTYIDKMCSEIDRKLGTSLPSRDDMTQLPLCYAVFLESLRYSSIVPLVVHLCSADDVKFEGYDIPKNATVFGNLWASHHDAELWEEPWSFRPERFLDAQGEIIPPSHPNMERWTPFGIGKRKCVGYSNTISTLFRCVVTIVQNFNLLPPQSGSLLSDDPRLYESGAVLQQQRYTCRAVSRCREPEKQSQNNGGSHLYNNN